MVQRLVRLTLLAGLLLSGCAVTPPASEEEQQEPVNAQTELEGSPAMALLERAETARRQGETAAAGRYLERAMTMAPDSSWLYRELAQLRLEEGDAHAAEGLALRALRMAPDNDDYRADLWELVAAARARQNDSQGAGEARDRAADLRGGDRA